MLGPLHLPGFENRMADSPIIGERSPNWSARKLLMCCSVLRMVNQPFLKPANEEGLGLKKPGH